MTIYEVKQKVIDALGEVDVSKLSIMDVRCYCESLRFLNDIKDDSFFTDTMKTLTDSMNNKWEPPIPTTLNDLK